MNITYSSCPICDSTSLSNVFEVKDHTVSGERFMVVECSSCSLRFTQGVPSADAIGPYYKSGDYISHSNTSKGLINRLYHWVRKRTIRGKRNLVQAKTKKEKGKLLDLGTGIGSFANEMKSHGWQVTGLEPDQDARAMALKEYGLALEDINLFYTLPFASFDAISMWHVLEHVHDLKKYVNQLRQVLKEDGRLFVAVPNYTSTDAKAYEDAWAAYDVPRHLYHFSPKSMDTLMAQCGLKVIETIPMWYDAYYISLLSSKYKNGKTNWIGAGWTAFRSTLSTIFNRRKSSSIIYIISRA